MSWFTDEENDAIVEMYNSGVTYEAMADALDRSVGSINWRIGKLIEQGRITKRPKKEKLGKIQGERPVQGLRAKAVGTVKNGTVNCTAAIKKKCYYGQKSDPPMCNYCLVEGHSRGCSPRECVCFRTGKTDMSKVKEAIERSERQRF